VIGREHLTSERLSSEVMSFEVMSFERVSLKKEEKKTKPPAGKARISNQNSSFEIQYFKFHNPTILFLFLDHSKSI
jgi:hypothetical protein